MGTGGAFDARTAPCTTTEENTMNPLQSVTGTIVSGFIVAIIISYIL